MFCNEIVSRVYVIHTLLAKLLWTISTIYGQWSISLIVILLFLSTWHHDMLIGHWFRGLVSHLLSSLKLLQGDALCGSSFSLVPAPHPFEAPHFHNDHVLLIGPLFLTPTVSSDSRAWVWDGRWSRVSPWRASGRLLSLLEGCAGWESKFTKRKRSRALPSCLSAWMRHKEAVNTSE